MKVSHVARNGRKGDDECLPARAGGYPPRRTCAAPAFLGSRVSSPHEPFHSSTRKGNSGSTRMDRRRGRQLDTSGNADVGGGVHHHSRHHCRAVSRVCVSAIAGRYEVFPSAYVSACGLVADVFCLQRVGRHGGTAQGFESYTREGSCVKRDSTCSGVITQRCGTGPQPW